MPRNSGVGPGMRRRYVPRPRLTDKDWIFLSKIVSDNGKWTVEVNRGHIVNVWKPGDPVEVGEEGS